LDHLLIFSERQLHRAMREYVFYFNGARPHQGLEQQIPKHIDNANVEVPMPNKILPFPGLKEEDREGRGSTPPESEANRSDAKEKIIAFAILNRLHYD